MAETTATPEPTLFLLSRSNGDADVALAVDRI